jgi:hypothetical protein
MCFIRQKDAFVKTKSRIRSVSSRRFRKDWLGGLDSIEERIRNPTNDGKNAKTNTNTVNRAICGKPKNQQHNNIRAAEKATDNKD